MTTTEIILRSLQSAFALLGTIYLISAFALPAFYLRYFSLADLEARKASKWRLWVQGLLTIIAVGVVVYAAAYALIAAVPFHWGSHDEDGEWQSTRDTLRFLITVVGSISLTFSMEKIARALAVEKFAKAAIKRDWCPPEIVRAAKRFHDELTDDFYSRLRWTSGEDMEFPRAVLDGFRDLLASCPRDQDTDA